MSHTFIRLTIFFIPFTGLLGIANGVSVAILMAALLIIFSKDTYTNKKNVIWGFFAVLFFVYGGFLYALRYDHNDWPIHIVLMPAVLLIIFIFLNKHSSKLYFEKTLDISFYTIVAIGCVEFYISNQLHLDLSWLYSDDRIYEPQGYLGLIRARSTFPESGHFSFFIITYFLYKLRVNGCLTILNLVIGIVGLFIAASSAGFACIFLIISYSLYVGKLFGHKTPFWLRLVYLLFMPFIFAIVLSDLSIKLDSISFLERLDSTTNYLGAMQVKDFFFGLGPGFYKQSSYEPPIGIIQVTYISYGLMGITVYIMFLLRSIGFKESMSFALLVFICTIINHSIYGGYYYFFSWLPLLTQMAPNLIIDAGRIVHKERF